MSLLKPRGRPQLRPGMLVDRSAFDRELSGEPYSLGSEACRLDHFLRPDYAFWCNLSKDPPRFHRKQWEFWYIFVALRERGKIAPGMRGLGFGVGSEPMADAFASFGCAIVATDQASEAAHAQGWSETNQQAEGLRAVRTHRVSSDEAFANVSFEIADMNAIGSHLRQFDFCWSSCAFEHLGSIRHGLDFVRNSIDTLKPGGVAVHTTELHMDSNDATIETRPFQSFAGAILRSSPPACAPMAITSPHSISISACMSWSDMSTCRLIARIRACGWTSAATARPASASL